MKLFTRRECWVPTARGWVVIAAVLLSCVCLGVNSLNGFLSLNRPVQAEVLIVESWLPDYALQGALDEFRHGGYKCLIAAAAGLPDAWKRQNLDFHSLNIDLYAVHALQAPADLQPEPVEARH
jgi:hypothetical protein